MMEWKARNPILRKESGATPPQAFKQLISPIRQSAEQGYACGLPCSERHSAGLGGFGRSRVSLDTLDHRANAIGTLRSQMRREAELLE